MSQIYYILILQKFLDTWIPTHCLFPPNAIRIQNFESSLYNIQVAGHQLLFEFNNFYMRVKFALHGQIVIANEEVFQQVYNDCYYLKPISWQIAIRINLLSKPIVLIFTDYNKVAQYILIAKSKRHIGWDPHRNCDPMNNWEQYKLFIMLEKHQRKLQKISTQSIYSIITSDSNLFNGFGGNQATEALHYARIHPMLFAHTVFRSQSLREQLFDGLYQASRWPKYWEKYIPKYANLSAPWELNKSAWEYFNNCVNQVYQKEFIKIDKAIYESLVKAGSVYSIINIY